MPDFAIESRLGNNATVFGFDEAGRGPWCGPVVAACACWQNQDIPVSLKQQIDDSKKLSGLKRERLFEEIKRSSCIYGIGYASAEEIDSLNILQATFLAMKRAMENACQTFHIKPTHALIDGNRLPKDWPVPCQCVIKGDHLSLSVATASILAKVTRDRIMCELAQIYPHYGWDRNAGYGTKEHIQALAQHGITPYHRRSYAPIKALIEQMVAKNTD
ncbi:MAG: ribonuclease HII [Alphaproteobacteria bacterium]|nr:ribonuclease HII [Alphaproteobacteria bacterium]